MGCKKTTVKIIKGIGRLIKPGLTAFAVNAAAAIESAAAADPDFWFDDLKRKTLAALIRQEWEKLEAATTTAASVEISQRLVNLLTEYAVVAAKDPRIDNSLFEVDDTNEPVEA